MRVVTVAVQKSALAISSLFVVVSCGAGALAAPKTATGTVTRISVSAAGVQGNNHSYGAAWSPDSQSVVFYTEATNLFPTPDPNQATYVAQATLATGQLADLTIGTPTGLKGASTYTACTLCQTHPEFSADGQLLTFYAQRANGLSNLDTSGDFSVSVAAVAHGGAGLTVMQVGDGPGFARARQGSEHSYDRS
jgi:hypothetical protein